MSERNLELEAQILKSPDDASLYQVYADWLGEKGDARGELIALAIAAEKAPSEDITAKLTELHARHDATWIGTLPEHVTVSWRRGFVDSVMFGDDDQAEIDVAAAYATFRNQTKDLPSCALLRKITLGAFQDEDEYMPDWSGVIDAMVEHGIPSGVREVRFDRGSFWDISSTQCGDISPIYKHVPLLETLYVELGHFDLGSMDLPALKHFEVYTGGFHGDNMKSVVEMTAPNLETLILRFGSSEDYGGTTKADDVRPLFASTKFGKVTHLALANAPFANEILGDLIKSPLLRQLHTLDLSWGFLDDKGVAQILEHADAFKHLKTLDVTDSYIKTLGGDLAARLPQTIGLDDQKSSEADDDYRYCHIGE